nr:hypothetical protein [Tanacetum cinerariifolium]
MGLQEKKDERGVVVRNKERLVAHGHRQEEGIDYNEVFALVTRIKAIRFFLAFSFYMGFIVYQMDVKSAFLYGTIDEEVYVLQPLGFVEPKFPNKVYKVVKALYGLHQAPRAWYATLSTFLEKSFTKKSWCDEFGELMKNRFQMSSMGELTFFLGLQVKQKKDGIFISQDKYVAEILKKFNFLSVKTASTPIETQKPLVKDEEAVDVDVHLYRFQVTSKTLHLHAVKRIFWYLKGQPKLGLWYPKVSSFDLESYSDSDYVGANLDRKSTTRCCIIQWDGIVLPCRIVSRITWGGRVRLMVLFRFVQLLIDHQLGDMSHHKDIYDNPSLIKKVFANMKRVGTGFSGVVTLMFDNMLVLVAKEVGLIKDNIQSISIPTEPSTSKPHNKHKPKKQQTQAPKVSSPKPSPEHKLPSPSNDPLPSGKDSLKLRELMDLCTHLSNKVLELESEVIDIKSTYRERIKKLEGRVDRLEEENKVSKELYSVYSKVDIAKPYRMDLKHSEKVLLTTGGATTTAKATKVNVPRRRRGVVIQDPEETTSTIVVHSEVQSKDKGKGILIEEPKSLKGQAHIEQNEAFARQPEAELNADINCNAVIEQVKRSERLVMKYQALKRKPVTEAQAMKNKIIYLKNMPGYKMNYFKRMTYSKIRPLFEKHYNYNQAFLEELNEEVTIPEKEVEVEDHKRKGESLEKEITKKQKIDEEAEELKSYLQIVSNDDDDVYTEC